MTQKPYPPLPEQLYELEQSIYDCQNVTYDIKKSEKYADNLDEALDAISILYKIKFKECIAKFNINFTMQAIQKSVRQVARQPVGARAIQTRGALQTKAGDWMQGPLGYDTKFDKTLNTEVE